MSVEGGMSGMQRRIVCVNCGKVFFAWRPDTAPGAKIKCYFCKKEMEDEVAKRPRPEPAPAPRPRRPRTRSRRRSRTGTCSRPRRSSKDGATAPDELTLDLRP